MATRCKSCKVSLEAASSLSQKFAVCQPCAAQRANDLPDRVAGTDLSGCLVFPDSLFLGDGIQSRIVPVSFGDLILLPEGFVFLKYHSKSLEKHPSESLERFLGEVSEGISAFGSKDLKDSNLVDLLTRGYNAKNVLATASISTKYGFLRESTFVPAWQIVAVEPSKIKALSNKAALFAIDVNSEGCICEMRFQVNNIDIEICQRQLSEWGAVLESAHSVKMGTADEAFHELIKIDQLTSAELADLKKKVERLCEDDLQVKYLARKLTGQFGEMSFNRMFDFGKTLLTADLDTGTGKSEKLKRELAAVVERRAGSSGCLGVLAIVFALSATVWSFLGYDPHSPKLQSASNIVASGEFIYQQLTYWLRFMAIPFFAVGAFFSFNFIKIASFAKKYK